RPPATFTRNCPPNWGKSSTTYTGAGFRDLEIDTCHEVVRFPSHREWLRIQLAATPPRRGGSRIGGRSAHGLAGSPRQGPRPSAAGSLQLVSCGMRRPPE